MKPRRGSGQRHNAQGCGEESWCGLPGWACYMLRLRPTGHREAVTQSKMESKYFIDKHIHDYWWTFIGAM